MYKFNFKIPVNIATIQYVGSCWLVGDTAIRYEIVKDYYANWLAENVGERGVDWTWAEVDYRAGKLLEADVVVSFADSKSATLFQLSFDPRTAQVVADALTPF